MLNKKQYGLIADTKPLLILKAVLFILTFAVITANAFTGFEYNRLLMTFTASVALMSLVVSLFYVRNNWYAVIILAVMLAAIYSGWIDCMWFFVYAAEQSIASTPASMRMMCVYALFAFAILMFVKREFKKTKEKDTLIKSECFNPLIVFGLLGLLVIVFFIGYSKPTDGSSRGVLKPIYEYSLILFIFAYMYSGKRWYTVLPTTVLLFAFAAKDLLYGGRKTAVSLIILFFLIFLAQRLSFIKVLPLAIVGVVGLSAIGHFRGNADFSLEQLKITINAMLYQKFAIDTMYSASYTGMTFIAAAADGIFSLPERLWIFIKYLGTMIVGGSKIPNANVPVITRDYYFHWYGGVLPAYGFFFFGWIGTALTGVLSGLWIKFTDSEKSPFMLVLLTWVTATCFSWVLYSPSSLLRGVMLVSIAYLLCFVADKISMKILAFIKKA